ncbi:MAG: hypothetical protein AAF206_05960 [Bacteroidota bacterium]
MKSFVLSLLVAFGLCSLLVATICWEQTGLEEDELILRSGFLAERPVMITNQKGETIALRVEMRGYEHPLQLDSRQLSQSREQLSHLKRGDEVLFHEKHPDDRNWSDHFVFRQTHPIYSFASLKGSYLPPSEGIRATHSSILILSTIFFGLLGVTFLLLFLQKIGWAQTD